MYYVMSDIHGEYDKFIEMLEKINFNEKDVLYILGDIIDRGPEPVKILWDISMRQNVYPLMGNHEIAALNILKPLMEEITEDNYRTHITEEFMSGLMEYQSNGGDVTLSKFRELDIDDRIILIEYMEEFAPYDVIDIESNTFILVHSGLGNYDPNKSLDAYSLDELTYIRPDYSKNLFDDKNVFVVCGHTPTLAISGKPEIFRENNYINIDCGAYFPGGRLACLRLNDMQEFYV